ncbi:MAG: hypothetical protein ILA15_06945 [Clostridiales bacterium]|nr:hypothetical protein [Clostridiales bacterium]
MDRQLGKKEDGKYYLFKNSEWISDTAHEISDRLIGYDPSEDPDSPYCIGCLSIMKEIKEISEEQVRGIIDQQHNS